MELNKGIVRTLDTCIGCNKCVAICPVTGSNVSVDASEHRIVGVNSEKCIHCGQCLVTCTHDARTYVDDTDAFFADLAEGKELSVILDPSFKVLYPQRYRRVIGILRLLGVKALYDASFGGDIFTWATIDFLQRHKGAGYIASDCPVAVEFVEKFEPRMLGKLLPLLSPNMATAVYAYKYLHDVRDIAYITPCLSRKTEMESCNPCNNMRYHVTLERLLRHLDLNPMQEAPESDPDLEGSEMGSLYAVRGGLRENIGYYTGRYAKVFDIDGFSQDSEYERERFLQMVRTQGLSFKVLDARSCHFGYLGSPTIPEGSVVLETVVGEATRLRDRAAAKGFGKAPKQRYSELSQRFENLNMRDFERTFQSLYKQPFKLPEDVLDSIFDTMGKTTEVARNVDCGFCGYPTCREMAKAVASGYTRVEDCVHYAQREAMRLYETDDLTGIPNLASFIRKVKDLLWEDHGEQFVIVYFDVQNFKMINDLYGFDAGDSLLKKIAGFASDFVGDKGLCARLMSDHFVLIMPHDPTNIAHLIDQSRENLEIFNPTFPISIDFGFYPVVDVDLPIEQMIDSAHMAQLTIKGSYDIRWAFYDEAMHEKMRTEAFVVQEMQRALADNQFKVYLQPQYDHRTREMVGAEALVRWHHPERGVMPPNEFIPVFEKNLFISKLDAFVWESVCSLQRGWIEAGKKVVPVSVNLSRIDLYQQDLAQRLADVRDAQGVSPHLLKLEITESAYSTEPEQLLEVAEDLRSHGFTIEMDDFGSGYSSLNTLYEMPVDGAKLDMRFIEGSQTQRGRAIIRTIVEMMRLLDIPLVAEGVETANQADFLMGIGCDIIQGYYYAKPLPVGEFEKLLTSAPQ